MTRRDLTRSAAIDRLKKTHEPAAETEAEFDSRPMDDQMKDWCPSSATAAAKPTPIPRNGRLVRGIA